MMKIKEKLCEQRGGSAVEFALLLVFLVMLLFGIIEFSLILYNQAVITNASREGARAGIRFAPEEPLMNRRLTDPEIEAIVLDYCKQYLITAEPDPLKVPDPDVNRTGDGDNPGDILTVTVEYHYDFFVLPRLPIGMVGWQPGIDLSARTIMILE